jgi:hypothetical protein
MSEGKFLKNHEWLRDLADEFDKATRNGAGHITMTDALAVELSKKLRTIATDMSRAPRDME